MAPVKVTLTRREAWPGSSHVSMQKGGAGRLASPGQRTQSHSAHAETSNFEGSNLVDSMTEKALWHVRARVLKAKVCAMFAPPEC